MLSYCLKCRKNTENKNPKVVKNGDIVLLTNCLGSNSKNSKVIKDQEASGLLSSFGIKILLSKTPLVGPFLF